MKNLLFGAAALFALVLIAAGPNTSRAATTCRDLLDNNDYLCHVKSDFLTDFSTCFRFTDPGVQSSKFDLSVDGISGQVLSCTCNATGSLNNPHFNASKDFHCVTNGVDGFGIAFSGKATPGKIKKMQGVNDTGDSFLAECVVGGGCLAAPGGANPFKH